MTRSQTINVERQLADPWVDSVFGSLSITDRINQLLIVEAGQQDHTETNSTSGWGGVKVSAGGPDSFLKKLNYLETRQSLRPLVFHEIGKVVGLNLDSVDHFGQVEFLHHVREPHLFYEMGSAVAKQCKALGISILSAENHELPDRLNGDFWKLHELNQGLIDHQIIPIGAVKVRRFTNDSSHLIPSSERWDMLLVRRDEIEVVHEKFRQAISEDRIRLEDLEAKCRLVLAYKKWAGLDLNPDRLNRIDRSDRINNGYNRFLKEEIAKYLLVATGMSAGKIPVRQIENKKIAFLNIGGNPNSVFYEYAGKYTKIDYFETGYSSEDQEYVSLWADLNKYDIILCAYYQLGSLSDDPSDHRGFDIFQDWLIKSGKRISVVFPDPGVGGTAIVNEAMSELIVLQDTPITNKLVPQLIFGGIGTNGRIRISAGRSPLGMIGVDVEPSGRFAYTSPEGVGLNSKKLLKIDSIATAAIRNRAIPGCQILIAKDHKVIYQKSFGYHTYDSIREVRNTDLYDLASVTKVSGALPALMKLYEEGRFDLEATMGTYLPYFKRGNKKRLTYREILAHQSGLTPYIVYWTTAIKRNGNYRRKTLSNSKSEDFSYEVSPGLYLHNDYKKKIYRQIRKSKLGEKKYAYSGLTFLLYPEIIEAITGRDYVDYLDAHFYKPLGAISITYNPLEKYEAGRIVPTEYDSLFRKGQIHGKVHDEAAAMMKGISSNAGLFANANDLAKLFQMYCNYGTFGNREYLNEETLLEFTRCQYPGNNNRRGLGFDRPLPEPHANGNTAKPVSQLSFGHSGFTGTFAWADPEYNLVYIFLSNRVYRTRENRKLYEMNIRTDIQEVIYEAMERKD
ncbi:MAG: serine hydrolase [Cytophagales bacterium]|nr:serine hydrolase [Cytophagales bacterium]